VTRSPLRKVFASVNTSPFGWIAGSGFWEPRPSSTVMLSATFLAASAIASEEPAS
jgi:hypothetical protein